MTSDLVAIPVTLAAIAVFGAAVGGFYLAGPIGGLLFALLGLGLAYLVMIQPGRRGPNGS
jgi:hypothetical protein